MERMGVKERRRERARLRVKPCFRMDAKEESWEGRVRVQSGSEGETPDASRQLSLHFLRASHHRFERLFCYLRYPERTEHCPARQESGVTRSSLVEGFLLTLSVLPQDR